MKPVTKFTKPNTTVIQFAIDSDRMAEQLKKKEKKKHFTYIRIFAADEMK